MPPQGVFGHKVTVRCWIPMDDTHTMFIMSGPKFRRPPTTNGTPPVSPLGRMQPNTSDWFGRFRMTANATNDYQIDRAKQRRNSDSEDFTGITGIHLARPGDYRKHGSNHGSHYRASGLESTPW